MKSYKSTCNIELHLVSSPLKHLQVHQRQSKEVKLHICQRIPIQQHLPHIGKSSADKIKNIFSYAVYMQQQKA